MWFVFSAMSPNKHETIYAPVSLDMSLDDRVGKGFVEGVLQIDAEPIPNIVTGDTSPVVESVLISGTLKLRVSLRSSQVYRAPTVSVQ